MTAGRAHIAVLLGELQRIHQTQHLVNVTPQRQVVDHLVLDDTAAVNQK